MLLFYSDSDCLLLSIEVSPRWVRCNQLFTLRKVAWRSMEDKWGKGFSGFDTDKQGSRKGKDEIQSKRGRKKKTDSSSKEALGKGKDEKTWNVEGTRKDEKTWKVADRNQLPKEPIAKVNIPDVQLKVEAELPKNARCLMDCEAASILHRIQEQLTILSKDPAVKVPELFDKGLQYAKAGNNYSSSESVRQILEILQESRVTLGEICMIGNLCPETVDEAYALIPSLKTNQKWNEGPIRHALVELSKLKQPN